VAAPIQKSVVRRDRTARRWPTRARSIALIQTAKLNEIDPRAWLADVLARFNDLNIHRLDE
jgi:hypothetical protein